MKSIILPLSLLIFGQAFGAEITLSNKKVDLGFLGEENNTATSRVITLKRNSKSPNKVNFTFKMNHLVRKCVDYEVKVTDTPEFTQNVCETAGDGSYQCQDKTYTGLYKAETICVAYGQVKQVVKKSFAVSFRRSTVLAPGAEETFDVILKQNKMTDDSFKIQGRVIKSHSLYKVKNNNILKVISFKAK